MDKAKVGILYVHGIGTQGVNFAERDIAAMSRMLGENAEQVAFSSYCWQSLIEPRERELMCKNPRLKCKLLRKLLASYGGDALCYQPRHGTDSFYKETHLELDKALLELSGKIADDGRLVIVSHSLGTIIVNNFIWDHQNSDSIGAASYSPSGTLLDRMSFLYTLGSPLAVWSMRYPNGGKPIDLPDSCLWRNIYSPTDIIGWPIKNINKEYAALDGAHDFQMWVGGPLTFWNPASHIVYAENKKVLRMIAEDVMSLLK